MFFYNRATMLIIALPTKAHPQSGSSPPSYSYWLSPNGLSISLSGQSSAALLPRSAGEVVAVIPWQLVSWHSLKLPALSQSQFNEQKLSAVLNGMLEDELLDEVNSMHFILPNNLKSLVASGREVMIGACSRDWLRSAVNALQDQGIRVQRIVCELTPTTSGPLSKTDNSIYNEPNTSELLESVESVAVLHVLGPASLPASAVLCTENGVIKLPPSTPSWSAFKGLGGKDLSILCEPHWVQSTSEALGREPKLYSVSQRMLDASLSNWDAATGEWEQSRSFRFYRNIQKLYTEFMHHAKWSLARQALLGLVVLNLVGLNLWSWIEGVNIKSSEQELSKLLKETFPAIGLIVDPSLQMQREMKRLKHARGQSATGDLESMLSAVAQQLPPNYRLQSFNYSANELRLNGVSKNLISGAGLNALEKAGYTLRAENTAVSGQMVPVLVMTFVDGSTSQN